MGPIDRVALREMAERATPGPWKSFDDVETIDAVNHEARVCYTRDGVTCEWCLAIAGETDDAGAWTESTLARWRSDARYIAAVSPTVVLALLDALDAAERVQSEAIAHCRASGKPCWCGAHTSEIGDAAATAPLSAFPGHAECARSIERAERERDEARADLRKYGEHHPNCALDVPRTAHHGACTCGCYAALARAEGRG